MPPPPHLTLTLTLGSAATSVFGGFHPTTVAIIDAITTAGATVSSAQRTAMDVFIRAELAAGRYGTTIRQLFLPVWGVAAANAVDWVTPSTSGTFAGSVTHNAGHVVGDASTGYFSFGKTCAQLGMTQTSAHLLALRVNNASISTSRCLIGVRPDATQVFTLEVGGNPGFRFGRMYGYQIASNATASGASCAGLYLGSVHGANKTLYRRKAGGITSASSAVNGTVPTSTVVNAMRRNFSAPDQYDDGQHAAWSAGLGMDSTAATDYTANLSTLYTALTGNALPA